MNPQDYTILQIKKGDFQDNYGNWYCSLALKGISEAVTIAVKDPTTLHEGLELYGIIENKTSRAGKPYLKFKRMQKEDGQSSSPQAELLGPVAKKEWQPRDDDAIRAQWAIGQAKDWILGNAGTFTDIEAGAKKFYDMVERVKTPEETSENIERARKQLAQDAQQLHDTLRTDEVYDPGDQPISLDDIPF